MKLALIHYHAEPGGVTTVLIQSAIALLAAQGGPSELLLVSGRDGGVMDARLRILEGLGLPSSSTACSVRVMPEIDYRAHTREFDAARSAQIRKDLQEISADHVLVIHNFHLGKNAEFTDAVLRLAANGGHRGLVFYIHDFPEAGRPVNLAYLRRHISGSWYPIGPGIRWVVINERDLGLLRAAGVPTDHSAVLFNPMNTEVADPTDPSEREHRRTLLTRAARALGFRTGSDSIWLYPVRAIRRKNVLESALLCGMLDGTELWLTLPGSSPTEQRYSDMLLELYRDGVIHGAFPTAAISEEATLSFPQLLETADLVISSSVQEGFGLTFVEAMRAGRPLAARYLDVIGDPARVFADHPVHFWNSVMVPLSTPSLSDPRPYLRMRYLQLLKEQLGPGHPGYDRLRSEVEKLLDGDAIDFSFLPPDMQQVYLRDLGRARRTGGGEWVMELGAPNAQTLAAIQQVQELPVPEPQARQQALAARFGLSRYAEDFLRLVDGLSGDPASGNADGDFIADQFTDLGYYRLLFQF